jgi:hypothetical protein
MRLLLDTHALLWAVLEPQKLSRQQREAVEDSDNQLLVSAASAWEIATKWRLGKLSQAGAVVHMELGSPPPTRCAAADRAGLPYPRACMQPSTEDSERAPPPLVQRN